MKKFIITLFIIAFSANIFAQIDNFKDGYVITNQGDTLFGKIDFQPNNINQTTCRFMQNGSSETVIYEPAELKGYYFSPFNKCYVSKQLEINGLQFYAFAELLVDGVMNLYYYEFDNKAFYSTPIYFDYTDYVVYYFFEDENGKMQSITKKPDEIKDGKLVTDVSYKGILRYTFRDVPSISDNYDKIKFDTKSIVEVAEKYHNAVCETGEKCIVYLNANPYKFKDFVRFSVYAGGSAILVSKEKPIFAPMIGTEIFISDARKASHWGANFDLSVLKYSDALGFTNIAYNGFAITTHAGVQYYNFDLKIIQPTGGGGLFGTTLFAKNMGFYFFGGFKIKTKKYSGIFIRANLDISLSTFTDLIENPHYYLTPSIKIGYSF
ncbi:MAG: hypothetical protein LBN95_06945 [Prevotellaceae bacterium]|jgi:hypothetical protein|nr:hypothetical protein [Prevotellaceae bacterium]